MMEKKRTCILTLIICLFFQVIASAETIVLKSGKTMEGQLIEKTDKYIKIDFYGVPLTYFFDEIESIGGNKIKEETKKKNATQYKLPEKETTSISKNDESIYFNNEFKFGFTVPSGWCVLGENSYKEYFDKLSKNFDSKKGYWLICFLIEQENLYIFKNNFSLDQQLVPLIAICNAKTYFSVEPGTNSARKKVKAAFLLTKQVYANIARIIQNQSKTKVDINSKEIRNNFGEQVLNIVIKNRDNGKKGVMSIYRYLHITKDNSAIHDFLITGGCTTSQTKKYTPIFDNFIKDFCAID